MASDGSSNPQTPVYTKAKPVINEGCINCGQGNNENFYNPATVGKTAEVIAGAEIAVQDISDAAVDRFIVSYDPVDQLVVTLTLSPVIASIVQTLPILLGKTVDRIIADWVYSEAVASQNLQNTGGLTVPTLADGDRTYDWTGLSVVNSMSVTINGDTGEGFSPESQASDTKPVTFGNYLAWGAANSLNGVALATAQSNFTSFIGLGQENIQTARQATVNPLGGPNEKFFFYYPKVWGEGTFQKGIFTGGLVRVKNVAGTLKHTLTGGDTETDILLDNGEGYVEAFYVYETLFDNQEDPDEPIQIL